MVNTSNWNPMGGIERYEAVLSHIDSIYGRKHVGVIKGIKILSFALFLEEKTTT